MIRVPILSLLALLHGPLVGPPVALLDMGGQAVAQETHVLVIAGLGGDAQYEEQFVEWGLSMLDAAEAAGVPTDHLHFLAEDPAKAPGRIDGRSTGEEVERTIGQIASSAAPEDPVFVLLIGHGSGSGPDSRVSLPGPSLRASEYAALFDRLAPRTVAFVNVASASGDFVPHLVGEGRIVVAATRSSRQRNATLFGGYFVAAYTGSAGDTDRDGRVSLLEAFEYARQETDRYYNDRGLIIPETALIEDRVDGEGTDAPMEEMGVGQLASRFFIASAVPRTIDADAETAARLRALYEDQARLEDEIALLRQRESTTDPAQYQSDLQALLLEIARVGSEIRALEGEQ